MLRVRVAPARILRCGTRLSFRRPISISATRAQEVQEQQTSQPEREAEDVKAIASLLSSVRNQSDPAHRSAFPMRSPRPWLETLLPGFADSLAPASTPSQPAPPIDLPPRRMHDSYVELTLPMLSQRSLLEQYTNVAGGIRNGKLMEHLDSLAGSAAYKHMLGPGVDTLQAADGKGGIGFYLVTAAVERMDMLDYIKQDNVRDLRLSGNVIYTGTSSMEVTLKMEGLPRTSLEAEVPIMLGRFTMVCRDSATHRSRRVNPLICSTPEEQALHAIGASHSKSRQQTLQMSLDRVPPSKAEAEEVHRMFLQERDSTGFLSSGSAKSKAAGRTEEGLERVWMEDTLLESCQVMFPQDRNVHGKVFGGYLMRLAYEVGFATASQFTRHRTLPFLSLDSISFKLPVPVGSLLRLKGGVGYADGHVVHVGVRANVLDVTTGEEQTTNEFWFTWGGDGARRVAPKTYEEAMTWLESKRRLALGAEIRALRGHS